MGTAIAQQDRASHRRVGRAPRPRRPPARGICGPLALHRYRTSGWYRRTVRRSAIHGRHSAGPPANRLGPHGLRQRSAHHRPASRRRRGSTCRRTHHADLRLRPARLHSAREPNDDFSCRACAGRGRLLSTVPRAPDLHGERPGRWRARNRTRARTFRRAHPRGHRPPPDRTTPHQRLCVLRPILVLRWVGR